MGDLRLTFWLLVSVAAALFIGTLISFRHFAFFGSMNETRVQEWLATHFVKSMHLSWWIPLLFLAMALLGINTFVCTCTRIASLLSKRNEMSFRNFLFSITPSIIHGLFLIIIFGHLVTFTMGEWLRVPIAKGAEVSLVRGDTPLVVKEIHHEYFPGNSGLRNRISRSRVTLENDSGEIVHVGYLKPVYYRGKHLLLDMVKTKRRAEKRVELKHAAEETCNKAANYHVQRLQKKDEDKSQKLQIKVIDDPGLYIIIPAFTLILIFMLWYFTELQLKR
jgi:hypothetical protein